jgi:hypothetical protein
MKQKWHLFDSKQNQVFYSYKSRYLALNIIPFVSNHQNDHFGMIPFFQLGILELQGATGLSVLIDYDLKCF